MGIIGTALGVAGGLFGGIKARKQMRDIQDSINRQRRKNQDWYDRKYNEDATQRADAQRILTKTEELFKQRNKAAAGSAAVAGATEESVAAQKAAGNAALADATSHIAAKADARKDAIEQQYVQADSMYTDQLAQLKQGRAQGIAAAAGELGKVVDML